MAAKLQAELRILTIHGVTWVMQYGLYALVHAMVSKAAQGRNLLPTRQVQILAPMVSFSGTAGRLPAPKQATL